ncbi:hypothetical protein HDU93_008512 [Gonapodya sp. JEL0774]|nr:hypothetical protein HDU93_008512 [Gonapodya sp. JEL0774]
MGHLTLQNLKIIAGLLHPDAVLVPTGMQARRGSSRPRRQSGGASDAVAFLDRPYDSKAGDAVGPLCNLPLPNPPAGFTVKPRESSYFLRRSSGSQAALSAPDVRTLWVPRVKVVQSANSNQPVAELVYDEYLQALEPKHDHSASEISQTDSEREREDDREQARSKLKADLDIILLMYFSEESDREINVPAKLKRELHQEILRENYHPSIFKPIVENLYLSLNGNFLRFKAQGEEKLSRVAQEGRRNEEGSSKKGSKNPGRTFMSWIATK